jgi:hypothetical protein
MYLMDNQVRLASSGDGFMGIKNGYNEYLDSE